jgi:DNA mismatch repair protein MutS2
MSQKYSAMLIHGAGTGALRTSLREWLRENTIVTSFKPGDAFEGGDGVTVVSFV